MSTTILTYDQWIKLHPEFDQEEKCVECNGTGETSCPYCTQAIECDECDGKGIVNSGYMEYQRQKAIDLAKAKESGLL